MIQRFRGLSAATVSAGLFIGGLSVGSTGCGDSPEKEAGGSAAAREEAEKKDLPAPTRKVPEKGTRPPSDK